MDSNNVVPIFDSRTVAELGPTRKIDPHRATYTVMEVARLLNLSRGLTYQYLREGLIPAARIGRRWLIPRKRFHEWLDGLGVERGA